MIHITEKAAKKVKEIADDEEIGHYTIRVKVIGSGCAGYQHDISFDSQISETDEVVPFDDIKVIVDEMSWQYIQNMVLDYKESDFGGGFTFGGPDVKDTCGCGSSVAY